ncbi:hypothetical protein BCR36DRAFT_394454 [Piromyces finnis]|uniref:Uncharacterized protein n=1 Tax=Piromyces finnis TaxID=1754191 RepID=A0A1Y1VM65_9FUNG|nr:hypothetical protein BCR36DRAFT_394454 [Piromyces finnis]|eukprot:ORX59998.1 hypothetical protein BCR36DRAFT_394454 [Piromyces finnis]
MELQLLESDVKFFKVQQQLFYLLTVSDDNPEKNVFINKEFYEEMLKKNYFVDTDCYGNNTFNYYYNFKLIEENRNYHKYFKDFKTEPPYSNIMNRNDISYSRNPNDYYNSRDEKPQKLLDYYPEQKMYLYRDHPQNIKDYHKDRYPFSNDYRRDETVLMNRKDYDNCYNNNYSNTRINSNDTNNDPNIMIPNNNYRDAPPAPLSHYSYNGPSNRYLPNDNNNHDKHFSKYDQNNSPINHKSSINFINGNDNDYDHNPNKKYNRDQENNSYIGNNGNIYKDNYHSKKSPFDMKERSYSDEYHFNVDRKPHINDDKLYRSKEEDYDKYSLPQPQTSNHTKPPDNEQNIRLPRIHEYIDGLNGSNINKNIDSYGRPLERFERDLYDRSKYSPHERYDPIRNNILPNDNRDRRNSLSPNNYRDGNGNILSNDYRNGRHNFLSNDYRGNLPPNDYRDDPNSLPPNDYRNGRSSLLPNDYRDSKGNLPPNEYREGRGSPPDDYRDGRGSFPPNDCRGNLPPNDYRDNRGSLPPNDYRESRGSLPLNDYRDGRSSFPPNDYRDNRNSLPLNDYRDGRSNISNIYDRRYPQPINDYSPNCYAPMDPYRNELNPKRSGYHENEYYLKSRGFIQNNNDPESKTNINRSSIDNLLNGGSNQVVQNNSGSNYPPKDLLDERFYLSNEKSRKHSLEHINDEDNLRKRQMSSLNDMRGSLNTLSPVDDKRNCYPINEKPAADNIRNHYTIEKFNLYNKQIPDHSMIYRNREESQTRENNDPRFYSSMDGNHERRKSQEKFNDYNHERPYNHYRRYSNNETKPVISPSNSLFSFSSNYLRSPIKSESKDNSNLFKSLSIDKNAFGKKTDDLLSSTTPINAIDMLEDDSDGKNNLYPSIKYKFKNYRISAIEKNRILNVNLDYDDLKDNPENIRTYQNVVKFMYPIIIDRFIDVNNIVTHRYLLNQYINFDILEFFFIDLNRYFSYNLETRNPIFLLVLVENSEFLNFMPDHLSNYCIKSVLEFSKQRSKFSKRDAYRYYLFKNQIKVIIRQCEIIRDIMINILNIAYIKHDVEQIKRIYNYTDVINTYKLIKACVNNDTSQISQIIKETSTALYYQTVQGYTPLHLAINNENIDVIKILLNCQKINVNTYNKYGFSPIFYSILKKRYDILSMILNHPSVDINYKNITGLCPLLFTVTLRNKEALEILLSHPNIDINITGKNNNTALISLLSNTRNYVEDYKRMIYHYFSLEGTKVHYGEMDNIARKKNKNEEEYMNKKFILDKISKISEVPLQQNELMTMLINHPNIDLSIKNNYYNNALFYATKNFNIEIVDKILRKSSYDVNERLYNGKTIFHKIIKKKSEKIKGGCKTPNTTVMNINNIISKKDQSGVNDNTFYNVNDTKYKHSDINGNNNLRPILPSPSTPSIPNSSVNNLQSPNINYYNGGVNDGKLLGDYNNYSYNSGNQNGSRFISSHNPYDQDRNRTFYPAVVNNEFIGGGESNSILTLYNMIACDLHQTYISNHENIDECQYCKAYVNYLNNAIEEYERLIILSTEDIIRYEIIKLFLENPKVNVNIQDNNGITPIMKAVMCNRFDLLILIFRKRLLSIDLSLQSLQNETSIQIASRLGYNDIIHLQLIHKIYLQHAYQ